MDEAYAKHRWRRLLQMGPLADVMNGIAPLEAPGLAPVFERMTDRLFDMLQQGWGLHTQTADPVVWHRRCYNKIADFLVNNTMDSGRDWAHTFEMPLTDFCASKANFICHSDGGTRQDAPELAGTSKQSSPGTVHSTPSQ